MSLNYNDSFPTIKVNNLRHCRDLVPIGKAFIFEQQFKIFRYLNFIYKHPPQRNSLVCTYRHGRKKYTTIFSGNPGGYVNTSTVYHASTSGANLAKMSGAFFESNVVILFPEDE